MGELAGLVAGAGFASGLSLYATVLLLGLAGRFLDVAAVPDELTVTPVLVLAGLLTLAEFVADKVPWLDSTWDAVHTLIRPIGAGVLGFVLVDAQPLLTELATGPVDESAGSSFAGGVIAALLAAVAHGAKASTRVAVNTSPEPFTNPIVSLVEDGLVVGLVYVAVEHPTVALVVVGVLTVLGLLIVVGLWRLIARLRRRRRESRAVG